MDASLTRLLKEADLDPSTQVLKELCSALIRSGYDGSGIKDEDVERIYALIYNPDTKEEYRNGNWVPLGKGYRYSQLENAASIAASESLKDGNGNVHFRLCVPTEDMLILECDLQDDDQVKELDTKLEEIKAFKQYVALQAQLEG